MQEGLARGVDRSLACPFLGLADDRGLRLAVPDRRHRCFAERDPAPRAIAHQEQYCLQAAFAVCPTFQDWARHESARITDAGSGAGGSGGDAITPTGGRRGGRAGAGDTGHGGGLWDGLNEWSPAAAWEAPDPETGSDEATPRGSGESPRDYGDPDLAPVWEAPAAFDRVDPGREQAAVRSVAGTASVADVPPFLAARLERSATPADRAAAPVERVASTRDRIAAARDRSAAPDRALARSSGGSAATRDLSELGSRAAGGAVDVVRRAGRALVETARRGTDTVPARRVRTEWSPTTAPAADEREPRLRDWERPMRRDSYPRLHVAARLPRLSVLWVGLAAVVLAALVLFLAPTVLPGLFGVAPLPTPVAETTPTPGPSAAPSVAPTPAAPTQSVYVVVQGDTLSGIAAKHGLTVEQLLKANPQIKNANTLAIGDRITIPTPAPAPASAAP